MKQIKAFVHRNRVGDLIHALDAAGFQRVSLFLDLTLHHSLLSFRNRPFS